MTRVATIPSSWKRRVHPRRGFASADGLKAPKIDAKKALAEAHAHYRTLQKKLLAGAKQDVADAEMTQAVDERWASGEPSEEVRVEAAVMAVARFRADFYKEPAGEALLDSWIATSPRGIVFAVDATLASLQFGCGIKPSSSWERSGWFALASMDSEENAKSFDAPAFVKHANDARPVLARLRRYLVTASDADYAAAVKAAAAHRKSSAAKDFVTRVAASYLFPTERAWVEEDLASFAKKRSISDSSERRTWWDVHCSLLVCSITSFADFLLATNIASADKLPSNTNAIAITPWNVIAKEQPINYLATVLEGLDADFVPLAKYWCEHFHPHKELAIGLAAIETEDAMGTLIDFAHDKNVLAGLTEAVASYPELAARVIEERCRTKGTNFKIVEPLKPAGGPAPARAPASAPASAKKKAKTASALLPNALVNPPWEAATTKKKPAKAQAIELDELPHDVTFAWLDDKEKERFASTEWDESALEPGGYLDVLRKGNWAPKTPFSEWSIAEWKTQTGDWGSRFIVVHAPEELSLEHVEENAKNEEYFCDLNTAIVRYGMRIAPLVIEQAGRHPKEVLDQIGPFDSAELAKVVAKVVHVKKLKPLAEAWLVRHPRATAIGLIPMVVSGQTKKDEKTGAVAALQVVANAEPEVVREVATQYGAEVPAALGALLGDDPRLAKKPPKAPAFFNAAVKKLPKIRLKDSETVIEGGEALDNLRIMLTLNDLERPFPGLREVLAACDRPSLAAFGWELFEAWQRAGCPNEEKWAFQALAVLGDDDAVRKLTPLIRKWPGESAHARATIGLEVLGAIGTDLALMSIHGIAERLKFPALKELAQKQIAAIAKRMKLSVPELEDRLVPTLDLDEKAGTMTLEHKGESFVVSFDEHLVPFVRPNLPKTAKDAQATLSTLKKDAKALASIQLSRLERAMVTQRRWTPADFQTFLVQHPLLIHVVRRLVWGVYSADDDEKLTQTFRVVEDRTFADVEDSELQLGGGDGIGIVHPMELDDATLRAWGKVFGEYEILQPFAQLDRGRHSLADALRVLDEIKNITVPTGKVLALTSVGWSRGPVLDSGFIGNMKRDSSIGPLHLELEQGFITGAVAENPEQTLKGVFTTKDDKAIDKTVLTRLPPIEASELAYSLAGLRT